MEELEFSYLTQQVPLERLPTIEADQFPWSSQPPLSYHNKNNVTTLIKLPFEHALSPEQPQMEKPLISEADEAVVEDKLVTVVPPIVQRNDTELQCVPTDDWGIQYNCNIDSNAMIGPEPHGVLDSSFSQPPLLYSQQLKPHSAASLWFAASTATANGPEPSEGSSYTDGVETRESMVGVAVGNIVKELCSGYGNEVELETLPDEQPSDGSHVQQDDASTLFAVVPSRDSNIEYHHDPLVELDTEPAVLCNCQSHDLPQQNDPDSDDEFNHKSHDLLQNDPDNGKGFDVSEDNDHPSSDLVVPQTDNICPSPATTSHEQNDHCYTSSIMDIEQNPWDLNDPDNDEFNRQSHDLPRNDPDTDGRFDHQSHDLPQNNPDDDGGFDVNEANGHPFSDYVVPPTNNTCPSPATTSHEQNDHCYTSSIDIKHNPPLHAAGNQVTPPSTPTHPTISPSHHTSDIELPGNPNSTSAFVQLLNEEVQTEPATKRVKVFDKDTAEVLECSTTIATPVTTSGEEEVPTEPPETPKCSTTIATPVTTSGDEEVPTEPATKRVKIFDKDTAEIPKCSTTIATPVTTNNHKPILHPPSTDAPSNTTGTAAPQPAVKDSRSTTVDSELALVQQKLIEARNMIGVPFHNMSYNLSRPRLRVGLSKRQSCRSLHTRMIKNK